MKFVIPLMLALFLFCAGSHAANELQFPVEEIVLDNGLTVLVVERHTAPVFSGLISVDVGSAWEKRGQIGSAHLLEHMMFKGSETIGTTNFKAEKEIWTKEDSVWARIARAQTASRYIAINNPEKLPGHQEYIEQLKKILDTLMQAGSQYVIQNEFDRIYTRNGASEFNATTGYDFTRYFVSLPANRLELWFMMESDRLKHPAFREFFSERDVVSEERRLSVENNSDSKLFEQLIGTAYIAHPYQVYWEWQSEVNNLTRDDLADFFGTYYIPENITLAIVGDVGKSEVEKLARKYFADMPSRPAPEPIYTREPVQTGERRVEIFYEANPTVYIAYHKTAFSSPDEAAFQVVERLLGEGRTSRLYKSLVIDQQLCLDIDVDVYPGNPLGDRYPGLLVISAYPKEGVTTEQAEAAVYKELDALARKPVSDRELTKIKNNIDADYIWGAYSNLGLAWTISSAQSLARDWHYLETFREKLMAVTPDDITRVAGYCFTEENRTVATLIPKAGGN
jgi:predicted Zn-dependent peptidase